MGRAGEEARERLDALRRGVSDLATRLYELADDPVVGHLTDSTAGGATAAAVADARPALDGLWLRFPALRDAVERFGDVGADRLEAELDTPIDDGTGTSVHAEQLLDELNRAMTVVTSTTQRLREVWDTVLPGVARARAELARLDEQAAALGVADDPTLRAAKASLARCESLVASDPLVVDLDILDAALGNAGDLIDGLARRRAAVGDRIAAARVTVGEVRELADRARTDLDATRRKIADPVGLLAPPDPAEVVDGDERALAPWLARIAAADDRGDWRAAEAGLERWEPVAAGHLDNARRAAAANRALLDRRNELRGLLDGLRAKAAAAGLVEDPALSELHAAAREVLYVAPCPLDLADQRVAAYAAALNDRTAAAARAAAAEETS